LWHKIRNSVALPRLATVPFGDKMCEIAIRANVFSGLKRHFAFVGWFEIGDVTGGVKSCQFSVGNFSTNVAQYVRSNKA
jgi:hypothetical protein